MSKLGGCKKQQNLFCQKFLPASSQDRFCKLFFRILIIFGRLIALVFNCFFKRKSKFMRLVQNWGTLVFFTKNVLDLIKKRFPSEFGGSGSCSLCVAATKFLLFGKFRNCTALKRGRPQNNAMVLLHGKKDRTFPSVSLAWKPWDRTAFIWHHEVFSSIKNDQASQGLGSTRRVYPPEMILQGRRWKKFGPVQIPT